ncbi:Glucan 1,3-beta-glucosidase 3 [Marasmius tenuissimus]|nr:Glucan 1,3-beta-glucosidase 3 [Marasmius tenuissimus]
MNSCDSDDALSYNPHPIATPPFLPFDPELASVYRYRQQQSVNLGSWFVAEEWMVPSIFKCAQGPKTAELDIAHGPNGAAILQKHWDTFVTQPDFDYLASIGINTIRLPIGYWSLGPAFCQDTPFQEVSQVYANSWNRVLRAISMAEKAGLGVLVDLHGAVGSQNGQAHSGVSDGHAGMFEAQANMDKTIAVLEFLVGQLTHINNVVGIQILNEPNDDPQLPSFYSNAISKMRAVSPEAMNFPLYIHNGFNLPKYTEYVENRSDFVVQDHHSYFVFTPSDAAEPASQHTSDINTQVSESISSTLPRHNLIVGEWSCALTPQSLEHEENQDNAVRDFCTAQKDAYTEKTGGWAFWSYKTEDCEQDHAWCFLSAVKSGALPGHFFSYNISDSSFLSQTLGRPLVPSNSTFGSPPAQYDSDSLDLALPQAIFDSVGNLRDPTLVPGSPGEKGFAEGQKTARRFAMQGLSKLGFVGQYIRDSLISGQAEINSKKADDCGQYEEAFLRALRRGEDQIAQLIATHDL